MGALKGVASLSGGSVFATSAGGILAGRTSVQGTKEWEFCSNRGDCNYETGQCVCFINPMPGYRSSDGYGSPGNRGDCGCANDDNLYGGSILACVGELACSGHGYCTGSPSFKCVCEQGWTTGDCSSPCSDVGICDRSTGQCSCYSPFEGAACEFSTYDRLNFRFLGFVADSSAVKCPGEPACSGHGQCMTMRQLSLEADADSPALRFDYGTDPNNVNTFDHDNILGCKCDPGSCPRGDDPITTDQVDEIQLMKCTATGGTFRLQYRTLTSVDIPYNVDANTLRRILMNSFGFEDPEVKYSIGTKACSPSSVPANIVIISFPVDHGDIPPLKAVTTSLTVTGGAGSLITADNGVGIGGVTSQKGTKENVVCSNRGYCNYNQGTCSCSFGYGTSDGRGNQGNRDDCGYILPKVKYTAQE
ncbi:unnamed protein product [Phytophthora lilii]|uniref:Unnamed protein product n=1 Tax=Phytophthora lilii TaxID=2077276 RepID=A0A9W6YK54_9STRA|nr:unnamed protein product [Phytophthora lilii]